MSESEGVLERERERMLFKGRVSLSFSHVRVMWDFFCQKKRRTLVLIMGELVKLKAHCQSVLLTTLKHSLFLSLSP